jgi:hypothetical protein
MFLGFDYCTLKFLFCILYENKIFVQLFRLLLVKERFINELQIYGNPIDKSMRFTWNKIIFPLFYCGKLFV